MWYYIDFDEIKCTETGEIRETSEALGESILGIAYGKSVPFSDSDAKFMTGVTLSFTDMKSNVSSVYYFGNGIVVAMDTGYYKYMPLFKYLKKIGGNFPRPLRMQAYIRQKGTMEITISREMELFLTKHTVLGG